MNCNHTKVPVQAYGSIKVGTGPIGWVEAEPIIEECSTCGAVFVGHQPDTGPVTISELYRRS